MTIRLYYDDPALLSFDATVIACEPESGGFRVALDRSAFYPTSGGQQHDLGQLQVAGQGVPVTDVVADDRDVVWHAVPVSVDVGSRVSGTIDAGRRRDFRQQHSGQHVLSASFDHLLDARTESVHLGVDACTLDLHREVSLEECRRSEDHANAVIWEDRPVAIRYADAEDLASEPRLRKATGRSGRIRLIDIDRHDLSACGGTHVSRTGEIGIVVIRSTERFRGGTRVTFLCGRRALADYRSLRSGVDEAARLLSVAVDNVGTAVGRLRDELKQEQRKGRELADRLIATEADALAARLPSSGVLVALLPDADAQALRQSASRLVAIDGRVVALLGGASSPHALVIARSADRTDVDAGALVRHVCATYGGKGGGRPDLAQAGGVAVGVEQLRDIVGG